MENENVEKTIEKLYKSAPRALQEALNSVELGNEIQEIGKEHQIHVDKLGHLYDEVTMVMLGLEEPNELKESLERKMDLPEEKIIEIVKDINEKVFEPIRESLKEMYPNKEETSSEIPNHNTQIPNNTQEHEPKTPENLPIIDNKLNETIKTKTENVHVDEPKENEHTTDPYKEPIE